MDQKESGYRTPIESIPFEVGEKVQRKDDPSKSWTILGFTDGKVRLVGGGDAFIVTERELLDQFEVASETDPLLREFEGLVE